MMLQIYLLLSTGNGVTIPYITKIAETIAAPSPVVVVVVVWAGRGFDSIAQNFST